MHLAAVGRSLCAATTLPCSAPSSRQRRDKVKAISHAGCCRYRRMANCREHLLIADSFRSTTSGLLREGVCNPGKAGCSESDRNRASAGKLARTGAAQPVTKPIKSLIFRTRMTPATPHAVIFNQPRFVKVPISCLSFVSRTSGITANGSCKLRIT